MHVFKTVKGDTKTDILCAIIQHNVHVVFNRKNMQGVSNSTKVKNKQNKKYITNLVFTALENAF